MFRKKLQELQQRHFFLKCIICRQKFDNVFKRPMILCLNQHLCCSDCFNDQFFRQYQTAKKCPNCPQIVLKSKVVKFQFYEQISNYNYSIIETHNLFITNKQNLIIDLNRTIQQLLDHQSNLYQMNKQHQKCEKYQKMLINDAERYFFEGDFQKTISICKNIIEINPSISKNFKGFGGRQQFVGYDEEYIKNYYKEYTNKITTKSPYDLLSLTLLLSSEYEEDKKWFQDQIQKNPQHYQLLFGLALLQSNFDNYEIALKYYDKVRKLNKKFDKSDQWMAIIYYSMGDFTSAREHALYSLDLNQINPYALFVKAMTQQEDETIKALIKLQKQYSDYLVPIHQLGQIYFNSNQYYDAKKCFQKCLQKGKQYDSAAIGLARCFLEVHQYTKTIELLQKFLEKDNKNEEIYMILALAHSKAKNNERAHQMIKKCRQINSQNEKIDYFEAEIYTSQQKYQQAIQIFKNLFQNNPEQYPLIKLITSTFIKKGDYYNSLEWYEECKQYDVDDRNLRQQLAQLCFEKKEYEQALNLYIQCTRQDQVSPKIYPKIIFIYNLKHMYEQSLHWAKIWTQVDPENPQSWDNISQIYKSIGARVRNKQWQPKKYRHKNQQ